MHCVDLLRSCESAAAAAAVGVSNDILSGFESIEPRVTTSAFIDSDPRNFNPTILHPPTDDNLSLRTIIRALINVAITRTTVHYQRGLRREASSRRLVSCGVGAPYSRVEFS